MKSAEAEGLLGRATRGQQAIVVGYEPREAMDTVLSCMTEGEERIARVRRSSGHEEIALATGGRIRFVRDVHCLRGMSADLVHLGAGADLSTLVQAHAVVAASGGEVVQA